MTTQINYCNSHGDPFCTLLRLHELIAKTKAGLRTPWANSFQISQRFSFARQLVVEILRGPKSFSRCQLGQALTHQQQPREGTVPTACMLQHFPNSPCTSEWKSEFAHTPDSSAPFKNSKRIFFAFCYANVKVCRYREFVQCLLYPQRSIGNFGLRGRGVGPVLFANILNFVETCCLPRKQSNSIFGSI